MAFWYRVKNSKIKTLSNYLQRCFFYSSQNSLIANNATVIRVLNNPSLITIHKNPVEFPQSVRFFAAPVQVKTKRELKEESGPRLNHKITADIVRLVVDEGHRVVAIREARELARKLNLDLVEVSRNAKPPVCKIMDYHKEKYKQEVQESSKKKKSELTLKKGDCKEVRFVGKIEQKDLKIKADTIKRMMERGYRVKCTAMTMNNEGEDLGAVLSRLSPLIEDVAYVESGPRVEKKQAYIVVRHVKFGPSKKGGKKALKEIKTVSAEENADRKLNQNSDAAESNGESDDVSCVEDTTDEDVEDVGSDWKVSGASGDSDKVFDFVEGEKLGAKVLGSANVSPDFARTRSAQDSFRTGAAVPSSEGQSGFRRETGNTSHAPSGLENRYRREPRNSFVPTNSVPGSSSSSRSRVLPDALSHIGKQIQPDRSTLSHTNDLGSQFLRKSPLNGSPGQHPSHSSGRNSASGYGVFGSPQADSPASKENNVAAENRYKKNELFNSGRNFGATDPRGFPRPNPQARRPDLGRRDGQGKYGIIESSNMNPNHNPQTQSK